MDWFRLIETANMDPRYDGNEAGNEAGPPLDPVDYNHDLDPDLEFVAGYYIDSLEAECEVMVMRQDQATETIVKLHEKVREQAKDIVELKQEISIRILNETEGKKAAITVTLT